MVTFSKIGRVAFWWVWMLTVLAWPVLKWVISINVFFHFLKMIYFWDAHGVYAGWVFLFHFLVLTGLTYFVSNFRPKGL